MGEASVVVEVRVPRRLLEEAERLGIDVERVAGEALRRAVAEERKRRLAEALRELSEALKRVDADDWVALIRSAREGRSLA